MPVYVPILMPVFFWASQAAKNKKANRELLGNVFEMIPLTVDAIDLCWSQYKKYFDSNGQRFSKGGFKVGDDAGAMVPNLLNPNMPGGGYRYAVATQNPRLNINESHQKDYVDLIGEWMRVLRITSLENQPLAKFIMESAAAVPPMTKPSVESQPVEPEAVQLKPVRQKLVPESVKPVQVAPVVGEPKIVEEPEAKIPIPSEEELPSTPIEKTTQIESQDKKKLLEQRKQKTLKIIGDILALPIDGKTLETMHGGETSIPFDLLNTGSGQQEYIKFIERLIKRLKNDELSGNLAELSAANMTAGEVSDQLTKAFACICANFDACIFWADKTQTAEKNKKQNRELLKNAFKKVVPMTVEAITLGWNRYQEYFNGNGLKFDQRGFEVGTLAGAMVENPYKFNRLEYRYTVIIKNKVRINENHAKTV